MRKVFPVPPRSLSVPRTFRVLVLEGGGMKAAYANGVLSAFEERDFRPWDAVLGTSAGGALAAWYSAGQAAYAEGTWVYARDHRILNYRRAALLRGPLLDHEALLDIVYQDEMPLDQEALRRARWPVVVTAVDVRTGDVRYVDVRGEDPIAWLKATGRLPFASGPPVRIDGRDYLDGGTVDPVPVRHAVEAMGATHVTLVLNKPPAPDARRESRIVTELACRRYPALRHGITHHQSIKQAAYDYAHDPPDGVRVDVVRPSRPTRLHRLSRDLDAINEAIRIGRGDGATYVRQAGLQPTR